MAGGTWETQNKVRPGVYINFKTDQAETLAIGERGVVAICEPLSWGPVGQIQAVAAGADTTPFVGYDITEPQARFLREIFKGTNRTGGPREVLLYRPPASGSAQAKATVGSLTATAKYPGKRGNDITIVITALTEPEGAFNVQTVVGGVIRDAQQAKQVSDLAANGWVTWSGEGAVTATTASALTGGQDGTVQTAAYSSFLTALEPYQFDVLIYDGEESAVLTAFQSFVERMVEDEGKYCQLVAAEMASPDSRFVINNISGAVMDDGTAFTPQQVCWWLGGAEAGASYNQSLTYARYPGAVDVSPRMANSQYVDAINGGQVALAAEDGAVKVEQDINTLVTFTVEKGRAFRKNRIIRLCSTIANDLYREFSNNYIGIVNNNEQGRAMFKSAIVSYLLALQGEQAIQGFDADDITVEQGGDIDSILVALALTVVDSVEKIYLNGTIS